MLAEDLAQDRPWQAWADLQGMDQLEIAFIQEPGVIVHDLPQAANECKFPANVHEVM
ncbi:hypothetical protein GCM10010977_24910 [Citricoccus zhacaiensis]|uniref:Uncharacterized protein n=1 Tax=Citricoccus zhacaiensis TaxID=489142 RepID=A0ABQ2M5N6_9MICC|nr:hypothetical protein GCM10010977_24910 [Citricoccus zhacaiensis]